MDFRLPLGSGSQYLWVMDAASFNYAWIPPESNPKLT